MQKNTMMPFKIWQLKDVGNTDYAFRDFYEAQKHRLSLKDYKEVYSGQCDASRYPNFDALLEHIFMMFNWETSIPKDFKGHALSVSDVVQLGKRYYYVDTVGFQLINKEVLYK